MVCCRCNRSGKCRNCLCVKQGRACADSLPSRQDACCNLPASASVAAVVAPATTLATTLAMTSTLGNSDGTVSLDRSSVPSPTPASAEPSSTSSRMSSAPSAGTPGSLSSSQPLPSLESVLRLRVSTLRHVPKASRDAWAGVLREVCRTVVSDPSNVDSWVKLFMLARCILANPSRGGHSHWRDIRKAVNTRLTKWRAGQLSELWDDVLEENNHLNRNQSQKHMNSSATANINRARRAVEDGQYRKAIQILSSAGIAPTFTNVFDIMFGKHPQAAPPPIPSSPVLPAVCISELDMVRALQSFPNGTAPGPSGLRANHLKEAIFCPSPIRSDFALRGLLSVVNLLCAGHAPRCIIPFLYGASLIACQKKDGGCVLLPSGRFCSD